MAKLNKIKKLIPNDSPIANKKESLTVHKLLFQSTVSNGTFNFDEGTKFNRINYVRVVIFKILTEPDSSILSLVFFIILMGLILLSNVIMMMQVIFSFSFMSYAISNLFTTLFQINYETTHVKRHVGDGNTLLRHVNFAARLLFRMTMM